MVQLKVFPDERHVLVDADFTVEGVGVDRDVLLADGFEVADGVGEAFFEAGHEGQAGGCFAHVLFGCCDVDWAALVLVLVLAVCICICGCICGCIVVIVQERGSGAF